MIEGNVDVFIGSAKNQVLSAIDSNDPSLLASGTAYLMKRGYIFQNVEEEERKISEVRESVISNEGELTLVIMTTEDCNLRCIYCCEPHNPYTLSAKNQDIIVNILEDILPKYHKLHIEWFGGEPLLKIDMIETLSNRIIDICKKNHVICSASCSTNGTTLTSDNLRRLLKVKLLNYQITIDGLDGTHDFQRPYKDKSGSWRRVISNLFDIRDHVSNYLFTIAIRTNITKKLFNELPMYIDFMKKNFGSDKRFHFYWRKAEDWGNISEENLKYLCSDEEYISAMRLISSSGLSTHMYRRSLLPIERVCNTAVKNGLVIFSDGRVGKCARDSNPLKTTIGTLDDFRRNPPPFLSASIHEKESDACSKCDNYGLCLGIGCPFEKQVCKNFHQRLESVLETILFTDPSIKFIENFDMFIGL